MLERITGLVNDVLRSVPGASPVSEEDVLALVDMGNSEGGPQGRHYVLDPIDGTRGFVGMRQYAVCLGMLQVRDVAGEVRGGGVIWAGTVHVGVCVDRSIMATT